MLNLKTRIEEFLFGPTPLDFYVLFIQIASFLRAGIPLILCLQQLIPQQKNKYIRKALFSIVKDLNSGSTASAAFKKHDIFPQILSPTLEAGEKASGMALVFQNLSEQMWLQINLYSKINTALLTPKIGGVLMTALVLVFAKIMVPQYDKLYAESKMEMPWITAFFCNVVNGIFDNLIITILILLGIYICIKYYFKTHPAVIDKLRLKLPIYAPLHFSIINHQFAENLALMLNSGLNIVTASQQTAKIVDNNIMKQNINKASKMLLAGMPIALAFAKANTIAIDPLVLSFIASGEKAGNLPEMLAAASDIHKTLINALLDRVSTKLTIIVLAPMGLFIIGIYIMSMIPMFSYFDKLVK